MMGYKVIQRLFIVSSLCVERGEEDALEWKEEL